MSDKLSRDQIRSFLRGEVSQSSGQPAVLNEEKVRKTELKEFSESRAGKKVASAGSRIISAANVIYEVSDNQTGKMREALVRIGEFVEKLGGSLSAVGGQKMMNEGETVAETLPNASELKMIEKAIKYLEK